MANLLLKVKVVQKTIIQIIVRTSQRMILQIRIVYQQVTKSNESSNQIR